MSCICDGLLYVSTFVKCGIIHDHHRSGWQLGNEVFGRPCVKYITVAVEVTEPASQYGGSQQSPDDIGSAASIPVLRAIAAPAFEGLAMGAGHVMEKAALVYINQGVTVLLMPFNPLMAAPPVAGVRLWMLQRLFYMSPQSCVNPARSPCV